MTKLEAGRSYKITIPETEYFHEEVKNILVLNKATNIMSLRDVAVEKIADDVWYYVYDSDRDKKHWYKINKEHLVETLK